MSDSIAPKSALEEAKRRAADQAHRGRVRDRIVERVCALSGVQLDTGRAIAEALMNGDIPHCEVRL